VTSLEYELHEVGPEVYQIFVWYHGDEAAERLAAFRESTDSAPRNVGLLPFVAHIPEIDEFPEEFWGDPGLVFFGCFRGDIDRADDVLASLTGGGEPLADLSGPTRYEDLQAALDEDYPDGLRYYWKSIYLTELTDEAIDLMVQYNDAAPSLLSTVDHTRTLFSMVQGNSPFLDI